MPLVAYGDMLFDSPQIFGGPARDLGISCSTCHNRSDVDRDFFIPGFSSRAGGMNVDGSFFNPMLNVPVQGFGAFDHAADVEALRNGDADISFMGALPFVLAEAQIGAEPLVSKVYRDYPSYAGRIFVRRDSGIKTLADLKGRDIAFADPVSESG